MILRIIAAIICISCLASVVIIAVAAEGWRKLGVFPLIVFSLMCAHYAIKGTGKDRIGPRK